MDFDIHFYIGTLRRRIWVMLAAFVVVSAGAFALAVLLPPIYESTGRLLVESQRIPSDLIRSTVTTVANERLQVIEQRITTRDSILGIAEKFGLFAAEKPNFTPSQMVDKVRDSISIIPTTIGSGRRGVTISFTVAYRDRNPQTAMRVASEMVTLILSEDVKSRTARAEETAKFIEREAKLRQNQLLKIETQISNYKVEKKDSLPARIPFQMSRLEAARNKLGVIDRELQSLSEQERMMQLEISIREAGQPGSGQSPITGLSQLKAELARTKTLYTDNHPSIRMLKQQIEALESEQAAASQNLEQIDEPSETDLAVMDFPTRLLQEKIANTKQRKEILEQQRAETKNAIDTINGIIAIGPETQLALMELQREQETLRTSLADLTSKLNTARLGQRLEQDQQAERFQVIEQPVTPTVPVKPNRPLILAGGIGAAGGVALGIMFLLELLNRSVRSSADITRAIEQPPLATIPYFTTAAERRRMRQRMIFSLLLLIAVTFAALVAIHIFYQPLDEIYFKILKRFDISW